MYAMSKIVPELAPIRCFLKDIGNVLARTERRNNDTSIVHTPSVSSGGGGGSSSTPPPPVQLRLIGTVVVVTDTEIVLDDGTAQVTIPATPDMLTQIHAEPSMTLDCIVLVEQQQQQPLQHGGGGGTVLVADQLVVVQDPHAEMLRWMELSFPKATAVGGAPCTSSSSDVDSTNTTSRNAYNLEHGYPTRKLCPDDILAIIVCEFRCQEHNKSIQIRGVSKEEIAIGLGLSVETTQTMIDELQLTGQVYKNEHGLFLPL
jgi:hypothetical protein